MSARTVGAGSVAGLLAWPLLTILMLVVVGWLPTRRMAGAAGVDAMLAGLGLVGGAVYASLVPAMRRMAVAKDAPDRFKAAFRAGLERFILTLALAGAVVWQTKVNANAFLVWVAVGYVVTIKVETLILIRWSKRLENRS